MKFHNRLLPNKLIDLKSTIYMNGGFSSGLQNQLALEQEWEQCRKPFYNVYPTIIPLLTRIKLDFVIDWIVLPTSPLLIRLPVDEHSLSPCRSILMATKPELGVFMYMDMGEVVDGYPLYDYRSIEYDGRMVTDILSTMPWHAHDFGKKFEDSFLDSITALCCALCLIGDDDSLIDPNLLRKDRGKVNPVAIARAFRRRGPGWDVGKKYESNGPYVVPPHPQRYWTGVGRTVPVIKVRSGYVVKKEQLTKIPTGRIDV